MASPRSIGNSAMNNFLSVGDITIHRLVEQEGPFLPALHFLAPCRRDSPVCRSAARA
jgi:hypothetical protein